MEDIVLTKKEVEAIKKLLLSSNMGFESRAIFNQNIYDVLVEMFKRNGYEPNVDIHVIENLVWRTNSVDEILKTFKTYKEKELGNLVYSVIRFRASCDIMGGQFSESFNVAFPYLVQIAFRRSNLNEYL